MSTHQNTSIQKRGERDNSRKCHVCTRTFSKTEHLERHIRSHTKEKPFQCQQCGKKYGRNDSLLRHVKDQHNKSQVSPGKGIVTIANVANPMDHNTWVSGEPQDSEFAGGDSSNPQHPDLGLDDWLMAGNLDEDFLRNWPFVIDETDLVYHAAETGHPLERPLADFRQSWYTHLEEDAVVSGYASPLPSQTLEVDENYRQSLHRRLQIPSGVEQNLPSTSYLNLCMKAYFRRFHPIFPVIHAPTFRPSKINAVLVLSMCSIGSLLTGHPEAKPRGIQLFERLNKAILSNWESLMRRGPEVHFAMLQAALLGQTFGLLSGQAKHLVLVDTFHGTIVAWARRAKVFEAQHQLRTYQDADTEWRQWANTEEIIRLALAVRIHDSEIANTLHHDPLLPFPTRKLAVASSDGLFLESSLDEWVRASSLEGPGPSPLATPSWESSPGSIFSENTDQRLLSLPSNSYFSQYSALEDASAAISFHRTNGTIHENVQKLELSLVTYYQQSLHIAPPKRSESLHFGLRVLWHFLFLSLYADLELLERCIGRDGPELSASDVVEIQDWVNSDNAKRCVAHSMLIKRSIEHCPLTSEPAIHVPKALFFCAICLFCYSKYRNKASAVRSIGRMALNQTADLNFPELKLLQAEVSSLLQKAQGDGNSQVDIGPLCNIIDLLDRIGHWEIARKYASVLKVLVRAESS